MDRGLRSTAPSEVPERGRRPLNRRQVTLAAASDLFYRRGFATVSMSEIASAVNMSGSAIYRHFPSKAGLLVSAIEMGLAPFDDVIEASATVDEEVLFTDLATCALEHPQLGVLWQREARNLGEEDQRRLRAELRATSAALARLLGARRPALRPDADLIAWCEFGVLVSVGFHSVVLPRSEYVGLLVRMQRAVVSADLRGLPERRPAAVTEPATAVSRRDRVLDIAARLFAEHGFGAVTVDQLGEWAGIRGPSLYNHFSNKQQLLAETIRRGDELLSRDAARILDEEPDPDRALRRLLASYISVTVEHRHLMRALLSEVDELDQADRSDLRRRQRDYIALWTDLLHRSRGQPTDAARIVVQAVLLLVNDAVQTPHLRELPGFEAGLERISSSLLALPAPDQERSAGR